MRVLITLAIVFFLLGGTYAYTRFAANVLPSTGQYSPHFSDQKFSLEISRTFTAVPASDEPNARSDRFPDFPAAAIRVLFKGEPILTLEETVDPREPVWLDVIPAVETGLNEIFVFARTEPPAKGELAAMQVQIRSSNRTLAQSTFTSQPGSPFIYGSVVFESPDSNEAIDDGH